MNGGGASDGTGLREIIRSNAGGGAILLLSAGGREFKGRVGSAAEIGDDFFPFASTREEMGADGKGPLTVLIRFESVAWVVRL